MKWFLFLFAAFAAESDHRCNAFKVAVLGAAGGIGQVSAPSSLVFRRARSMDILTNVMIVLVAAFPFADVESSSNGTHVL